MPELPDVEIFKRYLDRTASGRRVRHARVPATRVLGKSAGTIRNHLRGRRLGGSRRHGKYLLAQLDDGPWLVLHFGMTGYLSHYRPGHEPPAHERLRLDLDDGWRLGYSCQRLLGQVDLADDPESFIAEREMGPDALGLGLRGWRECLQGRRGALKSTLMNQKVLAGLGNIYSDEALFHARLHPGASVDALDDGDVGNLRRATQRVLEMAIDARADPDRLPGSWLLQRREEGRDCPRCRGKVRSITVGGRRGYYCPSCQRRP